MSQDTGPVTALDRPLDSAATAASAQRARRLPDPTAPLPRPSAAVRLHDAFVARAAQRPAALALSSDHGRCTYAELDQITRGLAQRLAAQGVGRGATVAIFANRDPSLIYAILGVLRSGATFQIIDAAYPLPRIVACLAQSSPALLLASGDALVPEELCARFAREQGRQIAIPAAAGAALSAFAKAEPFSDGRAESGADGDDGAAYISFTSGSTGLPKGIITGHAPLPHFIDWHIAHGELSAADRFSMLSGLSHDPLLRDIFTPLSLGAALHIPAQATIFDADALWAWFAQQAITVAHMTPAIGEILLAGAPDGGQLAQLRRVYWGGDVLSTRLMAAVSGIAPRVQQTNFYGATETPQAVAYFDLKHLRGADSIPIGRGIDAAQLLLVNDDGELCQVGESGEIWVRTPYLSKGYLDDPEQTRARFVRNPFTNDPDDVCYRTGDRGRYRDDGEVLYAGRADHQVKIRGFRVEPAEIVRVLEQQPAVKRAIVLAREVREEKQLTAYLLFDRGQSETSHELRQALEQQLPSYMVPKHFVVLPSFPLLPNGKVDLQALPAPTAPDESSSPRAGQRRMARSEAERQMAAIWADILGVEDVGIDESFLDLGGDSLSAIRALSRMRRLGVPEEVARGIFQGRTIAELTGDNPPTGSTVRPLVGTAKTTLLINVLRGLLVLLLVFDHWREGIFKRLDVPLSITNAIEFIFHLPTPGFAFVFGVGLGYTHYANYLRNRAATRRLLQGGALILAIGTLFMGLSRNLGVVAKGLPLDYDLFSTNFFLPTLYYWMALATAPFWFALMAKREGRWGGSLLASLLLATCCRGLYELSRFLLLEHEQVGVLQLGRLMLTARFSYFNLSTGALIGIFFGLYLRRERARPNLMPQLLSFGAAILSSGLALYFLQREKYPEALMSGDIWLPEWLFYLGATLLLGALVEGLLLAASWLPLRLTLEWIGVVGQCAMPIFILQGVVFDVTAFGRALGLRDSLAVALALAGFVVSIGWMMRRVHGLYYGRVPVDQKAAPFAAPI